MEQHHLNLDKKCQDWLLVKQRTMTQLFQAISTIRQIEERRYDD